jgi:replicative DNA helicase
MTAHVDPPTASKRDAVTAKLDPNGHESPERVTAPKTMRVSRADNGFEVALDELMRTGAQPLLWSVDERMRLIRRRAIPRVMIRYCQVVRLSLASGRQLDLASNLHVRKVDGWTSVAELSVGGRIAVLRQLSEPVQLKWMHDSEIIMVAHMIGDGSSVNRFAMHPSMRPTSWR